MAAGGTAEGETSGEPAGTGSSAGPQGYPAPGYAWYVVCVLTLAYVFSFVDRQILALLVEPIRRDLGISDTQMSLLGGFAFGLFYTLLGVPIGRLADRYSRRGIIAVGVTIWCLMTAACGLARNFWQLFLARVGVGVGEATLNPSALSLISDYFPRETRGRAISFYNMGVSLGVGLALIVGGLVIQFVSQAPPVVLPLVGELYPWQTVFIVVGLPGLVVALLMATVREPVRRGKLLLKTSTGAVTEEISIRETLAFLRARWRTYATHFLGLSVVTLIGYGFFFWIPTMFVRTWGWTIPQISLWYGLITLIGGPIGVNLGGWVADRLYRRGYKDGLMRTCLFSAAFIFTPASLLVPLMPTPELALLVLIPSTLGGAICTATGAAALMMIAPNQLRAQVTALYYLTINIIGLLGPTVVALFTDFLFRDEGALRYSIALLCVGAGVLALGFLFANLKHYRAGVLEAEGWGEEAGRPA